MPEDCGVCGEEIGSEWATPDCKSATAVLGKVQA